MKYKKYYISISLIASSGVYKTKAIDFKLPKDSKFRIEKVELYEEKKKGEALYIASYKVKDRPLLFDL